MDLFEILDLAPFAACEAGGLQAGVADGFQMAEGRLGLRHDGIMVHAPGSGEDHLVGAVMFAHEGAQVIAAEGLHPFGGAKDGAAEGLVDDVVGRVQRLPDFLQDHMAFYFDLFGIEGRVQHDIADHVQGQRHVILQDTRVIGGHLA